MDLKLKRCYVLFYGNDMFNDLDWEWKHCINNKQNPVTDSG